MNINKYISELDSNRFGILVAKLNIEDGDIENLTIELKYNGVKLIVPKVNN